MTIKFGPLEGVKVVELGTWVAVPGAVAILGDWGANVIKVENTKGGDPFRGLRRIRDIDFTDINTYYVMVNRNKRGIAIDLKKSKGKEVLYRLIESADVFLTNIPQKSLKKLRLGYQYLTKINRRLIYLHFSGFGELGPDKDKPGFDMTAFWTRGGFMHKLGEPGNPPPIQPSTLGDLTSAMMIAGTVSTALFSRERTGKGQKLEMSLYHNAAWCLSGEIQAVFTAAKEFGRFYQDKAVNPLWNVYQTKDERWIHLACVQPDPHWYPFCEAIEREDLKEDPRFNSMEKRQQNSKDLISLLNGIFCQKSAVEWTEILTKHNIIFERVLTITEVAKDPQAEENDFFGEIKHQSGRNIRVVNSPVKFSETPSSIRCSSPEFSQHTEEVLLELGYTWEDIVNFKGQGVIP